MKSIHIIICLVFISFSTVHAEENRRVSFYGKGNHSCGNYLSALDKSPIDEGIDYDGKTFISESRLYSEWLLGYVTAFNMFNNQSKNINNLDINGVTFWVKNYCAKFPLKKISDAAWALAIEQGGFDVRRYK